MPRSINTNVDDTRTNSTATVILPAYTTNFRTKSEQSTECTISNMTSPLALPQSFRSGYSSIPNAYKGTGIDVGMRSPLQSGYSVLFQNNETWSVESTTAADPDTSVFTYALPASCHIVVRGVNDSLVTVADIKALILRTVGAMLGSSDAELTALLRASLNPTR